MFKNLNPLLHSQLRLAIISYLVSNGKSDFNELKEITKATSGNISVQLKKLEKEKYITIAKGFLNNYQHTSIEITNTGIDAFEEYVNAIKQYIK
ncbi:winged helix DNA-binding protein [Gillisia sp. Hel_I_86]|uniref:winged helix-turn-helix domain-containing protein n=1 Tax=Gillisia sp. Hel_I_86 TaxID=1249981 RepID=UPI00119B39B6|nr:transcriptional regulator [Gillisia sp. Hel_I_86]TVZ27970.1 winged helix DNA-binding protein [Gillisia sp. Hel_I_86]